MRAALEEAKENAAKLRAELEQTRRERDRQLEQARLEAMHIIETTKAQSNEMLTELEQLRKQKEKASFGDDVIRAKGDVKRGFRKLYDTANPLTDTAEDEDYVLPRELKSGDTVMLADTKQKGVVLGKPDKNGNVFLQMGAMRARLKAGGTAAAGFRCRGKEEEPAETAQHRRTCFRTDRTPRNHGTGHPWLHL